jgi:hypothetical protein
VVTTLVVDEPQATAVLVVAGVEDAVIGDVGESGGSSHEDDHDARHPEKAKNTAAHQDSHLRSFAYWPPCPASAGQAAHQGLTFA